MQANANMKLYEKLQATPQEARKPIQAGRLKGFTDINPMWRFKRLTEVFGPCGVGWKYEIIGQRLEQGHGHAVAAFVDILLYFKWEDKWSDPVPGIGGSSFVAIEKNGPYTSDECFKMALTDAIGTACKALGMSADIYFEKDRTKYTQPEPEKNRSTEAASPHPSDLILDFGPYEGKPLGEIWRSDIDYIRFLRKDVNTPENVRAAIQEINEAAKKGKTS